MVRNVGAGDQKNCPQRRTRKTSHSSDEEPKPVRNVKESKPTRNGRNIQNLPETVGAKKKVQDSETVRNVGERDHRTARNDEGNERLYSRLNQALKDLQDDYEPN